MVTIYALINPFRTFILTTGFILLHCSPSQPMRSNALQHNSFPQKHIIKVKIGSLRYLFIDTCTGKVDTVLVIEQW